MRPSSSSLSSSSGASLIKALSSVLADRDFSKLMMRCRGDGPPPGSGASCCSRLSLCFLAKLTNTSKETRWFIEYAFIFALWVSCMIRTDSHCPELSDWQSSPRCPAPPQPAPSYWTPEPVRSAQTSAGTGPWCGDAPADMTIAFLYSLKATGYLTSNMAEYNLSFISFIAVTTVSLVSNWANGPTVLLKCDGINTHFKRILHPEFSCKPKNQTSLWEDRRSVWSWRIRNWVKIYSTFTLHGNQ